MNRIAICFLFTVFSIGCMAEAEPKASGGKDICADVYTLAEEVMKSRQAGVPLPQMMKISNGDQLMDALVKEAYGSPRFRTEQHQTRTIQDYADKVYLMCLNRK